MKTEVSGRVRLAGIYAGILAIGCLNPGAATSASQALGLCQSAKEPAAKIQFCTSAIEQTSDRKTLERLFLRRGNSYMAVGLYSNAASDFSNLISLNKKIAGYFDNRL